MSVMDVVAFVVLLVVLAVVIGGCLLLLRIGMRLMATPSRAAPRIPSSRPDDWDDEEYSARHHH